MKKKMDQLLGGKFEYEQPQLLFSCEKLSVTLGQGETARGEVYFGTDENVKIRGYITSSSRRFVPGAEEFSGTTICLPYGVDAKGLNPGENVTGWLCFTTNIGEYKLPFEIRVKKEEIRSSDGEVKSLEAFRRIAEKDFREAFRIFTSSSFPAVLEACGIREKALYAGLSRQPVTYQHLEEFLVATQLKEPVRLSLKTTEAELFDLQESVQESFDVQRSGWGHLRFEIEAYGEFLELQRHVVTDEDFIGTHYQVSYIVRKDKLGGGIHRGKIVVRSPYEELVFCVTASCKVESKVFLNLEEKRHRVSLIKDYIAYRTGRMDFQTWAASSHYTLNQLSEAACDYPEYQMYHAFLLHMEKRDEEAAKILKQYQNKSFTREDIEFAGVYLYLCTLTGLYKDTEQACRRVESFYKQKPDSFVLLYALLRMDPDYRTISSRAVFMMEELYERGCTSPLLYLEAWKYLKEDLSILHRLTPFWRAVFLFIGKRGLLTEEMVIRLAYLTGYEKNFETSLYRALEMAYEAYPSQDTLEAICKFIMQGNPRRPEYFKWYSLAVQHGVRLTRLYEYYVETMDDAYQKPLPRQLLMYFSYNTNSLGDARKALLYANIVSHKESESAVYTGYRNQIRKFAQAKLFEGRIGKNYAVLYQEFFKEPDNLMDAELVAHKMFTNRLYCDDKKIRQVIVRHSQMEKEEVYPLSQGVAYPRIFTEDAVILFQDDKQRRYVSTVAYSLQPLMDEQVMVDAVLDYGVNEPGLLLNYCEHVEICAQNMEIFGRLVAAEGIAESYRNAVRRKILSYYADHSGSEDLDTGLRKLDYHAYAQVNKKVLLELLIERGLFAQAMQVVEEFGCEGADEASLLKLASRMIGRGETQNEDELLALASLVYADGKYDEVLLRYLMEHRYGPVDELLDFWKSARGFDMDTFELEEKILKLLMFTGDYRKEGENVLESYVKQSGKERIIGAYLTQVSYGIFVKEYPVSPFIRERLEYAYKNRWPVNRICHFALLKALTKERECSPAQLEMEREIFKECQEEELIFSFFRRLPQELLSPYQLDDKTFVEYHASPKAKVSLVYALDTGLGEEGEYHTEPLKNQYEGIFARAFTLFYGETLRYYFVEELDGTIKKSPVRNVTLNVSENATRSKYQMINRILAARKLDKEKEVAENLKEYLRQEQYVKYLFRLEEEE